LWIILSKKYRPYSLNQKHECEPRTNIKIIVNNVLFFFLDMKDKNIVINQTCIARFMTYRASCKSYWHVASLLCEGHKMWARSDFYFLVKSTRNH
jgi:hypothetical protein